jgi:hypothetical protein
MKTETKAKYTFKTIVAPELVRQQFTDLRKDLNTSDKQLMQALWNIATADLVLVAQEVTKLKVAEQSNKAPKPEKIKKEKAAKPEKVIKKRQAKPSKEVVKTITPTDEANVGGDSDDMECIVVDGTAE